MASLQQEYPLVLLGILEELAAMRHWLSFQDLCRMVSTRFDLQHLTELRSLLFSAACRDPCFPATLFRDRVTPKGLGTSPIGVAADIVTIFNLIQMTGVAPDEAQASQPIKGKPAPHIDQSPEPSLQSSLPITDEVRFSRCDRVRTLSDSQTISGPIDPSLLWPKSNYSFRKRASLPPDPLSLVSSSPPSRARAVSFDWRHNTPLFAGSGNIPGMQSIYLPLETDSESSKDSLSGDSAPRDPGSEPGSEPGSQPGSERHSCVKKRDIFKKDFHNQSQLVPQVTISTESQTPRGGVGRRGRQELFSNRSFELLSNPYPSPTVGRSSPERRAKHESLDDLQDSTYFGPGDTIQEWSPLHLQPPRAQRPGWADKSLSLDDRVVGLAGVGLDGSEGSLQVRLTPSPTTNNIAGGLSPPKGWEGNTIPALGGGGLTACSRGTQTDTMPDPRRLRSLVHADRLSFMTSMDDPDMMGEDDISAIFRFLDDMSMCGSTGVLHPHDVGPSAAQDTPEARRGRLGQLQKLFHSLDGSDDGGLKASVCKLLLRMGQIERRLESLSEVKAEISQVLSFLQRLDEKIQEQAIRGGGGSGGRWLGPPSGGGSSLGSLSHSLTPGSGGSSEPQPLSVSGHSFGSLDWNKWGSSQGKTETNGGLSETEGGKKGVHSRLASSKPEEKSGADSKRPSVVSNSSARDWTVSFSKSKDGKAQPGKKRQMDQSNNSAQSHKLPLQKHSHLVEPVFSSSLLRQKGGGLTNPGLSSGLPCDPRLAGGGGGAPVWTVEDREARMSPLELQAQESLNPNNLEFWMEDIYTPGYDTLLRRKEADQRRAKACKLGALIFTAITIVLVIVIPIATMSS
ncbi:major intrinsically disordered Notch2-binding receptor 1-like [Salvelinus alpinus]|uniref:major intrinsically disordered Notch2-binding receptor 1-like n=1 Tax=Salvelinus alpinus TaxID=8036 RepID=UPI0039FBEF78